MSTPRLPRRVEQEPGAEGLALEIVSRGRPLRAGGAVRAPDAAITPGLATALQRACVAGRIVRGLEAAQHVLLGEQRGLGRVDRRTGVERGGRVSRLLLLADDGAERFYRGVESLVVQHEPRVLAVRLRANEHELGELAFGPGRVARLLLVEHKDAVSAILLALAEQWSAGAGAGS